MIAISSPKSKGPASLAGDPDHGSTNPRKGKAMNVASHTTPHALAPAAAETPNELHDLIAKCATLAAEFARISETGADDDTLAGLCSDVAALNNRIVACPVQMIGDVRAKANHLIAMMETGSDPLDGASLEPLLRSLAGDMETPLDRLSRAAFEYREAAQEIEPDAVDWSHARPDDAECHIRFRLEGRRNLVPQKNEVAA